MLWQAWWAWIAAGLVLAAIDVLIPTQVFLGLAAGAVTVGCLLGLGWVSGSFGVLLVIQAAVGGLTWLALRRLLGRRSGQVRRWTDDIND